MLAGPSSLMADNHKVVKPIPAKSKTSTAVHKTHKAPAKPAEPRFAFNFHLAFKLNLPWIPVILPFNPGTPGGDDNRLESSIDPNIKPRITDRVIDAGDDNGWENDK